MSKMGSHDPFEHIKHKLWPKEEMWVKLAIWLPTTKNQESPWFSCMQVACHIPLESLWKGIQLLFRPHANRRSTHKVMGPQSRGSPNCENFETPTWEFRGKMIFWVLVLMAKNRVYYKGEGGGFPQVRVVVSLVSPCLHMVHLCTKVF